MRPRAGALHPVYVLWCILVRTVTIVLEGTVSGYSRFVERLLQQVIIVNKLTGIAFG